MILEFFLFLVHLNDSIQQHPLLADLQQEGELILDRAQVEPRPEFRLYATTGLPRTENRRDVYLVLAKPDGTLYDRSTLVGVLCHELAHVISGTEHDIDFEMWETTLLETAGELGSYSESIGIDTTYPCHKGSPT